MTGVQTCALPILVLNSSSGLDLQALNLITTGNITASYFIGDGSQLTGISTYNASYDSHVNWTDGAGASENFKTSGIITGEQLTSTDDITMNGILTNNVGAEDTQGVFMNGYGGNAYTGTTETKFIQIRRDIDTPASSNIFDNSGIDNTLVFNHPISSTFVGTINNYAQKNFMGVIADHTADPFIALHENNYAMLNRVTDTSDLTSKDTDKNNYGFWNEVIDNVDYDMAGGTLIVNSYGGYIKNTINNGVLTNGDWTKTGYGLYVEQKATTSAGTSTQYGLYLNVDTGADINYGIYVKDTGSDLKHHLANDNQKTFFGTGEDTSLSFDGTDFNFNMTTGLGTFKFFNSTGYATPVAHDWGTASPKILNKGNRLDALPKNPLNEKGKLILDKDMEGIVWKTINEKDPDNCQQVLKETKYCYFVKEITNNKVSKSCTEKPIENWRSHKEIINESIEETYSEECGTKPMNITLTGGIALENRDILADLKQENQMLKDCIKTSKGFLELQNCVK